MLYAIYQENDDNRLQLMVVYTAAFREVEGADVLLIMLAQRLADTDLQSVKIVSGGSLEDFPQFLGD